MIDAIIKKLRPGVGLVIDNDYYIAILNTAIGEFKAQIIREDETIFVLDCPAGKSEKLWVLLTDSNDKKYDSYLNMLFKVA